MWINVMRIERIHSLSVSKRNFTLNEMQKTILILAVVMTTMAVYCNGQGHNHGQGPNGQGPPSQSGQGGLYSSATKFGIAQNPEGRPNGQGYPGQGRGQGQQGQLLGIRSQAQRQFAQGQGPDGQGPPGQDRGNGQGRNKIFK